MRKMTILCIAALSACCIGCSSDPGVSNNGGQLFNEPWEMDDPMECQFYPVDSSFGQVYYGSFQDGYIALKWDHKDRHGKAVIEYTGKDGIEGEWIYELGPGVQFVPIHIGSEIKMKIYESDGTNDGYVLLDTYYLGDKKESTEPYKEYLYPNQMVSFEPDGELHDFVRRLSDEKECDTLGEFISTIYQYVSDGIEYDWNFDDQTRPYGYIPDPMRTVKTQKGVCMDQASLMTAMLRLGGVPTKCVVGYEEGQYHAWVSVYTECDGWVDAVCFDGKTWSLMDPTIAGNSGYETIKKEGYVEKWYY